MQTLKVKKTVEIDAPGLPANIKRRREELKLIQSVAARKCGISPTHFKDLEKGYKPAIPWETLEKIAEGLETTPEVLMGETD